MHKKVNFGNINKQIEVKGGEMNLNFMGNVIRFNYIYTIFKMKS